MWCTACGSPLARGARAGERPRELGGFLLGEAHATEALRGSSLAGLEARGEQQVFEATTPGGARIHVAWVEWDHGEREVRRTRRFETPWRLDRRLGDQRLAVESWGEHHAWVELDQARLEDPTHAAVVRASEGELDGGARTCVRCALLGAGATAVGTRQEILGALDERRHHLCATFPREARRVAVAAFLLIRVAPLLHEVRARRA